MFLLISLLVCAVWGAPAPIDIVCDADASQLVVDYLNTTTILHLPCEVRRVAGHGVGRGAIFGPSFLAALMQRSQQASAPSAAPPGVNSTTPAVNATTTPAAATVPALPFTPREN